LKRKVFQQDEPRLAVGTKARFAVSNILRRRRQPVSRPRHRNLQGGNGLNFKIREVAVRKLLALVSAVVVLSLPSGAQQQARPVSVKTTSQSQESVPQTQVPDLPVRRVVLYKNGVGYFEHIGRVRGNEEIHIDFTSGQLNDALASLTVLDLDGGRISGVSYNSTDPLDKRLGALRLPLDEQTSVSKFLDALRGSRLVVSSGADPVTGRLLSVERKTRTAGGTTLEVDIISVVTDGGEIREVEVTPSTRVRLVDTGLHGEMNRYLSLLASQREQDLGRMTLATTGTGERQLFVSYISEVPVWKTTYRLVLSSESGKKPLLQGWAIVDNTVGEDWDNVNLSLVAGAPQSFIQQLSQPYYGRRAIVPLPQEYESVPQTHEARLLGGAQIAGRVTDQSGGVIASAQVRALDASGREITRTMTDTVGAYGFSGLPDGTYQLQVEAKGFKTLVMNNAQVRSGYSSEHDVALQVGEVSQTVTVTESVPLVETSSAELSSTARSLGSGRGLGSGTGIGGSGLGAAAGGGTGGGMFRSGSTQDRPLNGSNYANLLALRPGATGGAFNSLLQASTPAAAEGQDFDDLYEYKLKDRVTIRKNQSAMVPIVQSEIRAEKVSLWTAGRSYGHPLRGVWLSNTSGETLDGGNFSVLDDEIFAGQGLLDPIKPDERRLLSYATDLGMIVRAAGSAWPLRYTRVLIGHGVMIRMGEEREKMVYTIRNEDAAPRTLIIEYPLRAGWSLSKETMRPEETTASDYRFHVAIGAKQSTTLEVIESHPLQTQVELTSITPDEVAVLLKDGEINSDIEQALRKILDQKTRVAELDAEAETRDNTITSIYDDQQRLRENLKALKGSAEEKALTQRYTQQLSDQETRLEKLRKEKEDFGRKSQDAQGELDKMIEDLAMEVTLEPR
jgi:Carboxypeptidase regulatory-like domain